MSRFLPQRSRLRALARQRGVTLIELMVGMAIGLVSVVIITQVVVLAEGQKRTTATGSDAQVNGVLALNQLQRDFRSAGYGFANNPKGLGCQVQGRFRNANTNSLIPAEAWTLAPVRIEDGADGAPDTIRVMASNTRTFAVPLKTAEVHGPTARAFVMPNDMRPMNSVSDVMLVIPGDYDKVNNPLETWCTLFSLFPAPAAGATVKQLPHQVDPTTNAPAAPWNPQDANTPFPPRGYVTESLVINMGTFMNRLYSVDNNQLMRQEFQAATGAFAAADPLFTQIVNLQAIYGKDTDGDGVVDAWDNVQPTTNLKWREIQAIRLALVARSQYEREEVTFAAPQWHPALGKQAEDIKVSRDPDWKHYRYKVYEALVPLRNVIWHAKDGDE